MSPDERPAGEVRVQLSQMGQDENSSDVVVLQDDQGRTLQMVIGPCEAAAIWLKLDPAQARELVRRPLTHDLLSTLIERLGGKLERVLIDDLSNSTFFAKLFISINGRTVIIDARPSDSIALALRQDAPIFASEAVMRSSQEPDDDPETSD
jgi:bifunctional DNase/RNase